MNDRLVDAEVSLGVASVGFNVAAMGAMVAVLSAEFAVPAESLSWVGSTFGVGLILVAIAGRWVLAKGPYVALVAASATFLASTLLVVFSGSLPLIFGGTLLGSLAGAVLILVAPIMLTTSADVRLTRANAIASLIGISASPLIGVIAGTGLSGRLGLLVLVPTLGTLLWLLLTTRDQRQPVGPSAPATTTEAPASRPRTGAVARRWLAIVMSVSVEFCFVVWGVTRLKATGLDTSLAAILGLSFSVGLAGGRFAGGWIIRHLPAVPFGASVAALGTLLVVFTGQWPTVAAGLVIAGIGVATLYPVTLARLMAVPGLPATTGAALGAAASGVAIVLAPIALASLAGVVDLTLAFLIPLPLLAILVFLHGRSTRTPVPQATPVAPEL